MGIARFFRRARWDRERREEIESYIRMETDDNIARGMPEKEARLAARRKFGNSMQVREEIYTMNTINVLDTVLRDLRYGLRMLVRNPVFTVVALLTLAIGIGANTAVFTVVNSVLLNPLRYPEPSQLVAVWQKAPGAEGLTDISGDLRLSASMYFTYSEQNRTLQSMGIWSSGTANVTGLAQPEEVRAIYISDGVLQSFAVPPSAGRWLLAEDQKPGGEPVVMLSHGYWLQRFGGDRSIIGRTILVNSRARQIVGVLAPGFRFGNTGTDLVFPLAFDRAKLSLPGFGFQGVARLKPGVTISQANADLARLVPVWMHSWPMIQGVDPNVYQAWRISPALRPLQQDVVGNVGNLLWVLMGTIGIVLLIASANVANLLLVRADARQQELAVRAALGAGRGRIVRSLLVESMLLGLLGGALGLGLAYAGIELLVAIGPGNLPRLHEISLDGSAIAFTVSVSLLSGFLFGLIPALKYAGPRISSALHAGGRANSHSREHHRGRNILVVVQVALAVVLLIGSGLMIRTFQTLRNIEPGFRNPEHLQTMRIVVPGQLVREPERVVRLQNDIADKIAAIGGVTSVAYASELPMETMATDWDALCKEGQVIRGAEIPPLRMFRRVSPGIFRTMGTRLIAGREYTWVDLYDRRPYVMVSQSLARSLWGSDAAAVGKRVNTCLPNAPLREVIGVVQDVYYNGVQESAPAIAYWPAYQTGLYNPSDVDLARGVTFAIRSDRAGGPEFMDQVRQAVWSVNANLPVASVSTMRAIYDQSLARTSFIVVMLAIAGTMALLLGLIGIYGVMSYSVSQRRREIGIRLALGAQPRALRGMFVRYGVTLAGTGVLLGLAAAAALMRLMKTLLFGVSPLDPVTYLGMALVLVATAVLASYLPARRAAYVNPVEAIRAD